jgi:aspartate racemase
MKTLGLIGGISWVSTVDYYTYINRFTNEALGANNFSRCIIYSMNYEEIIAKNKTHDLSGLAELLSSACIHLERSGAEAIILCANTMHMIAEKIQEKIKIPLIHIAEVTATEIRKNELKKVALLGTKFTMELDFFKLKLAEQGIETVVPSTEDREFIHQTIFEELGKGIVKETTKTEYLRVMQSLIDKGCEGIILGCTEIPLLIKPEDCPYPTFDTTLIHSKAAVAFSLN